MGNLLLSSPAYAESEPLPSWNESESRKAIINFVEKLTNSRDPSHFVPIEDRIAVFDNDGTLWAERPQYFQLDFLEANKKAQPQVKLKQLPKNVQKEIDANGDGEIDSGEIKTALADAAVFEDISTEEYIKIAADFVNNTNHNSLSFGDNQTYSRFDAKLKDLTYKPVIELVNYLKDNGFKVYICSGGGVDFVRSFADKKLLARQLKPSLIENLEAM